MERCGEVERERERVRMAGGASSKLGCELQRRKTEMKKMKKFFCGEVCALEFARVGVQGKMADEHRECRNQVANFVELANNLPVRVG